MEHTAIPQVPWSAFCVQLVIGEFLEEPLRSSSVCNNICMMIVVECWFLCLIFNYKLIYLSLPVQWLPDLMILVQTVWLVIFHQMIQ